jgi:hypothetical protein
MYFTKNVYFTVTSQLKISLSVQQYQRLWRACVVHLVIKRTNWSYMYLKTMSCSGSHLGIPIKTIPENPSSVSPQISPRSLAVSIKFIYSIDRFIGRGNRRVPAANHWQNLSHNVSSTPFHEQDSNYHPSSGKWNAIHHITSKI